MHPEQFRITENFLFLKKLFKIHCTKKLSIYKVLCKCDTKAILI